MAIITYDAKGLKSLPIGARVHRMSVSGRVSKTTYMKTGHGNALTDCCVFRSLGGIHQSCTGKYLWLYPYEIALPATEAAKENHV